MTDQIQDKFKYIPDRISGLVELAYNLWWSWHPEARMLFKMLDRATWKISIHNPVKTLHEVDKKILNETVRDQKFLRHYDAVMARFKSDMITNGGWFSHNISDPNILPIAYFSAEYGLHHSLPFYAGGLGFLAGDFIKECSDLKVPLVAVGFMYPGGYLKQRIKPDGWQVSESEILDRENAPIYRIFDSKGNRLVVKVPFIDPPIYVEVWKVQVGKVSLYLMDTDIDVNDPWNRDISDRLYSGGQELRLRQEIILGIGGAQVLNTLGIKHSVLHLNEGHPAFAILERIRERVESGMKYQDALDQVKATTVFTTHTPVPAGHDVFPFPLMEKYFSAYWPVLGLDRDTFFNLGINPEAPNAGFNMTAFALRMSSYHNGVSKKHGEVAKRMWKSLWPDIPEEKTPIDYITNGIHVPTWIEPKVQFLFNKYLGYNWLADHDDRDIWKLIYDIPDEELWNIHSWLKMKLIINIRERARRRWHNDKADTQIIIASGVLLDPNILTLGFARRFATYKRATLILHNIERLRNMLNDLRRPVQIIFAGKAHPDDNPGKQLLQQIFNAAKDPSFGGRIVFVEDYDEQLAQYLVHGVDIWLNNPLPPLEASGTSGMKASLNGVPQLSILDGWWLEGFNGKNGWGFGGSADNSENRNVADSDALYTLLENEIIPTYYRVDDAGVPRDWVKVMKEAIESTSPLFSARRMVKEYAIKFYQNALKSV
ncbi:MAG: alpha-glucan phosphorylase [Candidatus Brocadia sp.]|uniref:glycogen phosphorylase n=1 Tax=Candidatus Brocadia fulgida TaxID=380242 RepID=A0A0M2UYP2_9BACT|nr:MAG: glycogen phosphorylase [Candidatus Brocadia fulgida]MCC6326488.1 alpha-glucan family phosphorylase [Candidatus Brocadia sp.]MCE7911593.1 alpha-glucan family phosphorylase [Candidatus Brocadia sp. AMX3]MBV6518607.1 Glycogen phosphorylase [Candidatus Brocadia fulgida]MDG5997440.1 alpha-glucan family phosphorylase [Candidatus Brocadia sp.]